MASATATAKRTALACACGETERLELQEMATVSYPLHTDDKGIVRADTSSPWDADLCCGDYRVWCRSCGAEFAPPAELFEHLEWD